MSPRPLIAVFSCLVLAGCQTTLYGVQSSGGGTTATATSTAITASTQAAGGKIAFSSGAAPAPGAPGGQVTLGRGASGVLLLGLVVVDAVSQFAASLRAAPRQAANELPASIADTCSCYGYKPVLRDE